MCFFKVVEFQAYTDNPQLKPDYYLDEESHEAYLARRRKTRKAAQKRNAELNKQKRVLGKTDMRSKLAAELNAAYNPRTFSQASYDAMEPSNPFEYESQPEKHTEEWNARILAAAQADAEQENRFDVWIHYSWQYAVDNVKDLKAHGYCPEDVADIYHDVFKEHFHEEDHYYVE